MLGDLALISAEFSDHAKNCGNVCYICSGEKPRKVSSPPRISNVNRAIGLSFPNAIFSRLSLQ